MGSGIAVLIAAEEEELALRAYVKMESHIIRLFDDATQSIAGIAGEGGPIGAVDVADQTGGTAGLVDPREDVEGIQIRYKIHIRFLNADKPLNRRTVKHALVVQSLL